jgi:hypothetical protein
MKVDETGMLHWDKFKLAQIGTHHNYFFQLRQNATVAKKPVLGAAQPYLNFY